MNMKIFRSFMAGLRTLVVAAGSLSASTMVCVVYAGGIGDTELGLSKTSVFDSPPPPAYQGPAKAPGQSVRIARTHVEQPPLIPHSVQGLMPITRASNACKACHDHKVLIGLNAPGPVPMPISHYTDIRDSGKKLQNMDPARYVCTQCHRPQNQVKPLVKNDFGAK